MVGFSKSINSLAKHPLQSTTSKNKAAKNGSNQIGLGKLKKKRRKIVTIERKKSKKRKITR